MEKREKMTAEEYLHAYETLPADTGDGERERLLLAACAACDAAGESELPARCALYNELGGFYRARKRLTEGERAFLKAQTLLERAGAEKEFAADYATTLNNLAGLYRLAGRYVEAISLFDKAQHIYDALPDVPPDVRASCRNNAGLVLLDTGDGDGARRLFNRAVAILPRDDRFDGVRATTLVNLCCACRLADDRKSLLATAADLKSILKKQAEPDELLCRFCDAILQEDTEDASGQRQPAQAGPV